LRDQADDANNPELNGYFAIKMIKKTEVIRLKQADHVRNESLIHSKADHPFLTTLFYRFQDDRHLNIVMEYVQCGSLHNLIQQNSRLPNEVARFYAAQIVMAVQYLHGEHIIFRDLNPSNILLDRRLVRARRALHAARCTPRRRERGEGGRRRNSAAPCGAECSPSQAGVANGRREAATARSALRTSMPMLLMVWLLIVVR
jgi:serine/threonine protein kinase